ncbi:cytochrome P450 4C1-like isoform X2 [Centruroides sculpturatus]|uniref:cytochrome P450 4C1-like isoform X2 n=1 Tax=Centruroides sculpturatus TaxID=218467 RepID=UPI000C6E26DD|nr:cytochrome P450 4C1-like isoform X2 [Centruroides sculpturatus]
MQNILQIANSPGVIYTVISLLCFLVIIYTKSTVCDWMMNFKDFNMRSQLNAYLKLLSKLKARKIGMDMIIDETYDYKTSKGYITMNLIFMKWVFVFHPKFMKMLLEDDENIDRPIMKHADKGIMTDSLLIRNGDRWRIRKKLHAPAFTQKTIDKFQSVIDENARKLVAELKEKCQADWTPILPIIKKRVFYILLETVLSFPKSWKNFDLFPIYDKVDDVLSSSLIMRLLNVFLWPNIIFSFTKHGRKFNECKRIGRDILKRLVIERQKDLNTKVSRRNEKEALSIIDLLLPYLMTNHPDVTIENVVDDVMAFLGAGHHSFTVTMTWAMYELGRHPKIQEKIQEELDEIFRDDPSRTTTKEDLSKMAYLECVLKETLRKYPAVPFTMRSTKKVLRFKIRNYIPIQKCLIRTDFFQRILKKEIHTPISLFQLGSENVLPIG